jgi:hypothetical protein
LAVGFFFITSLKLRYMKSTESHISSPVVLIVPPGSKLTPLEKIFRPFKTVVWIAILIVFSSGFLFICIVNKTKSQKLSRKVFGEVVNPPYLNMIDICFGGSMASLPKKSFPRILLTTFLIFCFVIRNIYQGLLYNNMQSDDRTQGVMTVDEMIEKEFDFHMYPDFSEATKSLKFRSR